MVEFCLAKIRTTDPGSVPFYIWIRRLFDTVDLRITIESIYIKKQLDIVHEYKQITPLVDTIMEKFLTAESVLHPEELGRITPLQAIELAKEHDLETMDGVVDAVEAFLQLLELYVENNKDTENYFIDLFYLVLYQLYCNLLVIMGRGDTVKHFDIRSGLYVQGVRP